MKFSQLPPFFEPVRQGKNRVRYHSIDFKKIENIYFQFSNRCKIIEIFDYFHNFLEPCIWNIFQKLVNKVIKRLLKIDNASMWTPQFFFKVQTNYTNVSPWNQKLLFRNTLPLVFSNNMLKMGIFLYFLILFLNLSKFLKIL